MATTNNLFRQRLHILIITATLFFVNTSTAQIHELPPNQPEQDACNALLLCGNSFYTPYSYTGTGNKIDLNNTPCSGGEINSVWLKLIVDRNGKIIFKIKPVSTNDDYDFAVLNITKSNCDSLPFSDVVRCNFNNNSPGSNINGIVGLDKTSSMPFVQAGVTGSSFCQPIDAIAGEVYLIMINNFGNYNTGGPSEGFTIDFSSSTASFSQGDPPNLSDINVPCKSARSIDLQLSSEIRCSSIAKNGSDFVSNAPIAISAAEGVNCSSDSGYTNIVTIDFSSSLPAGNYTLHVQEGTDNNTLLNLCNVALPLPSNKIPFTVLPAGKGVTVNQFICNEALPYLWNGITVKKGGDSAAIYTTVSHEGCDSTTILNLSVGDPAKQRASSATICDGEFYVLPWDSTATTAGTFTHRYKNVAGCDSLIEKFTLNIHTPPHISSNTGFCKDSSVMLKAGKGFITYLWNTGDAGNTIVVHTPGTYTAKVTDSTGCTANDSFFVVAYPDPVAAFDEQTILCGSTTTEIDAGAGFKSYLWNNGSTGETISVNEPGAYWVKLTDVNNCLATDTTIVISSPLPSRFLPGDIIKCSFDDVTVMATGSFRGYAWSDGNNSRSLKISTGGIYWLDVTDDKGCTGRDSIIIKDSICPEYVYIPTGFTPNNDNKNDVFKPLISGKLLLYNFAVYNRWGKKIFSSNDFLRGWNGNLNGIPQPAGTYTWLCEYQLSGKSLQKQKGTITLIR